MKNIFVVSLMTLCWALPALASGVHTAGFGFGAPGVNGTSNVGSPEAGQIIFDTSSNSFMGYVGAGWVSIGGSSQAVPSGAVMPFAGTSTPTGWFMCDGSAVSRTTYAALFAAIGTTYGSGDGSTTFNLPNTGGLFVRGAGSQTVSGTTYSGTLAATEGPSPRCNFILITYHS